MRGRRFAPVRWVWQAIGRTLEERLSLRRALRLADGSGAKVCWAIMGPRALHFLDGFTRRSPLPVHLSVHDDPFIFSELSGQPPPLGGQGALAKCLRNARSRDCISARLCDRYRAEFGVDSFVLTRGLDLDAARAAAQAQKPDMGKRVRVILGGRSGRPPPWPDPLIGALRLLRERNHVPVELHVFDPAVRSGDECVHSHGLLPEPDFNAQLLRMHIGYACDPLTDLGRRFAATSFPTKVVTYIGASLPFVYHGPLDSTVADLLADYRVGVIVDSDEPASIADAFRQVIRDYDSMREQCLRAVEELFDVRLLRRRLFTALVELVNS